MAKEKDPSLVVVMVSAAIGATINSIATMPFDVLKTRMQSQIYFYQNTHTYNCSCPCTTGYLQSAFKNLRHRQTGNFTVSSRLIANEIPSVCKNSANLTSVNKCNSTSAAIKPDNLSNGKFVADSTAHVSKNLKECLHGKLPTRFRIWHAVSDIASEGGIYSFWRGLSPSLAMAVPSTCIYFSSYNSLRQWIFKDSSFAPLYAGCIARFFAATITSPLELFKTRLQSAEFKDLTARSTFKLVSKQLSQSIEQKGMRALLLGLEATLLRDVPFSGLYWLTYEFLKEQLVVKQHHLYTNQIKDSEEFNCWSTIAMNFSCGAAAGGLSSIITQPLDVAKTFLQTNAHSQKKFATIKTLVEIHNKHGLKGLFRGAFLRCAKVAPACAIMIASYEAGKVILA